jgi:hypothetical protein
MAKSGGSRMIAIHSDGVYVCSLGDDYLVVERAVQSCFDMVSPATVGCMTDILKDKMPKVYDMFKDEFSRDSRATFCMWQEQGVWRAES